MKHLVWIACISSCVSLPFLHAEPRVSEVYGSLESLSLCDDFQDLNFFQKLIAEEEVSQESFEENLEIDEIDEMLSLYPLEYDGICDESEKSITEKFDDVMKEKDLLESPQQVAHRPKVIHRNVQLSKQTESKEKEAKSDESNELISPELVQERENSLSVEESAQTSAVEPQVSPSSPLEESLDPSCHAKGSGLTGRRDEPQNEKAWKYKKRNSKSIKPQNLEKK